MSDIKELERKKCMEKICKNNPSAAVTMDNLYKSNPQEWVKEIDREIERENKRNQISIELNKIINSLTSIPIKNYIVPSYSYKYFENEVRIKYYLNNVNNEIIINRDYIKNEVITFDDRPLVNKNLDSESIWNYLRDNFFGKYCIVNKNFNKQYAVHAYYFSDLYRYLSNFNKYSKQIGLATDVLKTIGLGIKSEAYQEKKTNIEYIFNFGDCTRFKKFPCFVKAKTIGNNDYTVLLKLNTPRHIGMFDEVLSNDIPFHMKSNKLLWRGSDTGKGNNDSRNNIILQNQNKNPYIDIKFCRLLYNRPRGLYKLGNEMSYAEMLQYKFLLSLEGNDVATNLKWILLSNSVVLMPTPTKCSWFMEDMLIPFVHYIPLNDDLSDIEEKYKWCLQNLAICEQISKNATQYMRQFLNNKNEEYITNEVIKRYLNNVKFI